jgi:hypothetical protein
VYFRCGAAVYTAFGNTLSSVVPAEISECQIGKSRRIESVASEAIDSAHLWDQHHLVQRCNSEHGCATSANCPALAWLPAVFTKLLKAPVLAERSAGQKRVNGEHYVEAVAIFA